MANSPNEEIVHDYKNCKDTECDECQYLVDYGIITSCDYCGVVGDNESDGWRLAEIKQTDYGIIGKVACLHCFELIGE